MDEMKKKIRSAAEGKLHIHVTISGTGAEHEERNEVFCETVDSIRKAVRRLRKRGIEGVSYIIEKSDG